MSDPHGRMTLWGIEVFLAVAEEGGLSLAARRLGVSVSAVSQQVSGLEAALGATLLDRTARPLALTPAGTMFRRHAQTILTSAAEAKAALGRADLSSLTTLRLGMIEDFDADVTPRLLTGLSEELKGCRFLLETGPSHRLLDQLEARALDIAVAADEAVSDPDEAEWREQHPLMAEPFVAVTAKGAGAPAGPVILYTSRHMMGRRIAGHLAQQGFRAEHRFELDSYHAILAMVAAGAGWSILTPLALHQAARFRDAVAIHALPMAPFGRTLSLYARRNVLGDLPATLAGRLRSLLDETVIAPALRGAPQLAGDLRVLTAPGA
jgi:DNA-binding transcriptional LysR family regulator